MKNYIVASDFAFTTKGNVQFDSLDDAIHLAQKRQRSRKGPVVVWGKSEESEREVFYTQVYNAKGMPLVPVRYRFVK